MSDMCVYVCIQIWLPLYCSQLGCCTFKALSHAEVAKALENDAETSHLRFARCLAQLFDVRRLHMLLPESTCLPLLSSSLLSWATPGPYFIQQKHTWFVLFQTEISVSSWMIILCINSEKQKMEIFFHLAILGRERKKSFDSPMS